MATTSTVPDAENPRKIQFYDINASTLQGPWRQLLREYGGIPDQELDEHVQEIRLKAFKVCPYPCIGMFQFLDLSMMTTDVYPEVLERMKRGDEKFLDLGCCLAQEVRQLVLDGAPSANTYASDLWGGFFPVGNELFKDEGRLETTFIAADVFDDSSPLTKLAGQINIIYTGALFHLFSLEEQEKVALRVVQLLASRPGSLIIGRQSGSEVAGESSRTGDKGGRGHFQHNPQSWKEFWIRIGDKTGTRWAVEADVNSPEFTLSPPQGTPAIQRKMSAKGLRYTVRRL
ncbi:hypothetical protein BX600DRAFT_552560 [Xylariales sp. PMI_506]|nr:hypothetical protein BX600DRAFT_552560 [Xylariales sp. PMI_506]